MGRNWTDSRDGSEWEISAIPILKQLRFSSQDSLQLHGLVVSSDVASRLSELTDSELAAFLDEARGFALGQGSS